MALINAQSPTIEGYTPNYTAVSASDTVDVSSGTGNLFVIIKNAGATADTATVVVPGTEYGQQRPDIPVNVPAGGEVWVGPLSTEFEDTATGDLTITHSVTASVTCAVVRM